MLHESGFHGYTQSCKILLYAFLCKPFLILEAYSLVQGVVHGASALLQMLAGNSRVCI